MFTNKQIFKQAFAEKLALIKGKDVGEATALDAYKTLGVMVREYVMHNWVATRKRYREEESKQVYYFSMEYLLGRLLESNLLNLGFLELCRDGLLELGLDLDDLIEAEPDAGLGNGGLGRLAACFLDSLASQGLPGHGCGIRYKYGLFEQRIAHGYQVELPEYWLRDGNVWEIRRPEEAVEVKFGGGVRVDQEDGRMVFRHENYEAVLAVPYDIPVVGYRTENVNTLRLWNAEAVEPKRCAALSCYRSVVDYKHSLESITELLYPDDSHREGKLLRLKQQYFLVSAGLQSIVSAYKKQYGTMEKFHRKVAIHVNDTHPVLAIPELMRILLDEEGMTWEQAWEITTKTISYTNHTTLSEALEKWAVDLFQQLLPRVYKIVEEINNRFSREIALRYAGDWGKICEMAIIADGQIKMAHLAIVGSHSVNGVARLHTEILKQREMKDFYAVYPGKFNNKTNGITHRRWLLKANPRLAGLITDTIGPGWIAKPDQLAGLLAHAGDSSFRDRVYEIKQQNKAALARVIEQQCGLAVDCDSIFDVQVKRMHAYKRQLLNVLHILDLYYRLRQDPELDVTPRTFIFGAKAFPNYHLAKKAVKLINAIAAVVNNDPRIKGKLKVVFLENYRVSLAEQIIPAADLSEQISTAGKEASGTGNMKFMLNGALTIGTMDGANIEIWEAVGDDNIFIFGLTAEQVMQHYRSGDYRAWDLYHREPRLKRILDSLVNGFLPTKRDEFTMIYDHLLNQNDEFFVLKDFASYVEAQEAVERAYRDRERWLRMAVHNIARAGSFSSDGTISRYADEIWGIHPVAAASREDASSPTPLQRYA